MLAVVKQNCFSVDVKNVRNKNIIKIYFYVVIFKNKSHKILYNIE